MALANKRFVRWFKVSLVLNGIGSGLLLTLLPYLKLTRGESNSGMFVLLGILSSAGFAGTFVWGPLIDKSTNLWRGRMLILTVEFLCSLAILASAICYPSDFLLLVGVAVLQFLFPYEVIWSRVAFVMVPGNEKKQKAELAREITLTTSLISIMAPALGVYLGMTKNIILGAAIDFASYLPYAGFCLALMRRKREYNPTTIAENMNTDQPAIDGGEIRQSLGSFVRRNIGAAWLLSGISFLSILSNAVILALPILLFVSSKETGLPWKLTLFYAVSSILSSLFGTKRGSRLVKRYLISDIAFFVLLTGLGILFASKGVPLSLRMAGYLAFSILGIVFSIRISAIIYQDLFAPIRGRFLGTIRNVSALTQPVLAAALAMPFFATNLNATLVSIISITGFTGAICLFKSHYFSLNDSLCNCTNDAERN
jgi:hypothetical protein